MSGLMQLPRGTQDYAGESYAKLDYLRKVIDTLYKKYHGQFVETPVFELTSILMDKYGEDEKLIYNIESGSKSEQSETALEEKSTILDSSSDQLECSQKERLSLRYDHTVPLVRYCLVNKITKMRRCCIGKVYRRETTTRSQVRLREFFQADFDYVGVYDDLVPELEIFCMIQELFRTLGVANYQILYNYRQNLDYYVKESGITAKFATVCSAIDKLDKRDKKEVREELLEKGCTDSQIDKLYEYLFSEQAVFAPQVADTEKKFNRYIDLIGTLDKTKIKFVPTLARGSDYYTGIIFEVKLIGNEITSSVSGGGRYDRLIPSYKKGSNPDETFPMIGFSFGVDRLLPLVKVPDSSKNIKIWVSTIGKVQDPVKIKLELIGRFSSKGYGVFYNLSDRKFKKEISDADENGCNFIVIVGEAEWAKNMVTIKNMTKREQVTIPFDDIDKYFAEI